MNQPEITLPLEVPVNCAQVMVIIPVYNEIATIIRVLEEVKAIVPDARFNLAVLVVEMGSRDGTVEEARRQKGLAQGTVQAICVLDPDGDLVDYLNAVGLARRHRNWACYHTNLDTFLDNDTNIEFGIIGRMVGAPFTVLVAEELFASGCQLLISIASAGQINPVGQPLYMVLIEKALLNEGTSYHYLPVIKILSVLPMLPIRWVRMKVTLNRDCTREV